MTAVYDIGTDEVNEKQADFTRDGVINLGDFALFSHSWRTGTGDEQWYVLCDLFEDGQIDLDDLAEFVINWLWQATWYGD
ncbi:unnamed protein product [marine sediment metagenome]|uniref:EF-hand domain-containing protein n=1 Tax=marine sediment metagenome TaxID=412755 RepID=X0ZDP6_9ZZZZ